MLTLKGHTGAVTAMAFSPDGRYLATGGTDGRVLLWRPPASVEPVEPPLPAVSPKRPVTGLSFQPDGSRLVAARSFKRNDRPRRPALGFWEMPDAGRFHAADRTVGSRPAIQIDPFTGDLMVVSLQYREDWGDTWFQQFALPDWRVRHEGHCLNFNGVGAPLFAVGSGWLAFAGTEHSEHRLRDWHPDHRDYLRDWPFSDGRMNCVALALSGDGRDLYVLRERSLTAIRTDTKSTRASVPRLVGFALAVSPDGLAVAVGGRTGVVRMFEAGTLTPRTGYRWPLGDVTAVAFSPDGLRCAAAGGDDGTVVVWDLE